MGSTIHSQLICCLIFLLFLGEVSALDCNNVNDQDSCLEILNDNSLTDNEKEMLISALIYSGNYPNHELVYNWNKNAELDYEGSDNGYIQNAWVKIKGISPSVLIDDELYCRDGKILADYNYDVNIPDYQFNGDCRTEWSKESENSELNIYQNNNYIGNSKEVNFDIDLDSNFLAVLNVNLRTRIDHYEDERYCCGRRYGRCVNYCYRCVFEDSDVINNHISVSDELSAKYYNKEVSLDFEVLNENHGSLSFTSNVENGYINIEFEDSYYNSFNYIYGIVINDGLLTLKAFDSDLVDFRNIIVSDFFSVRNGNGCKIIYGDSFESYEYDCDLDYDDYGLVIDTNKLSYDAGEKINVSVYPSEDVVLSYGNEEVIVNGNYEFTALKDYNRIEGRIGNEESYKIIHVKNDDVNVLFNFGVFFGFSYFIYLICKKYYKGWV